MGVNMGLRDILKNADFAKFLKKCRFTYDIPRPRELKRPTRGGPPSHPGYTEETQARLAKKRKNLVF